MPNKKKNQTNGLKKSNASSKLGSATKPGGRSAATKQRLQLYNSKPIRNKAGQVVGGQLMMAHRAGDREITAATGRIQPDRRWFGNTRVVDPTQLDTFRAALTEHVSDPYSVVLNRKKLPLGLLQDVATYRTSHKRALLEQEPFEETFGGKRRTKRVKLQQLLQPRTTVDDKKKNSEFVASGEGQAEAVAAPSSATVESGDAGTSSINAYASLMQAAQQSQQTYESVNTADGMVPWGRDSNMEKDEGENDYKLAHKEDLFLKGQSKRIWGEFFKVIDCSDVILHVIDARNVPGTRCQVVERHVAEQARHKHLVFVLNKIDLVPQWVAKRWLGELAAARPTIAFHASLTHAFGKGALISLLRQFGKLHADKKHISVGVVGYPNVGKSSVINCLISKKSCKVAPVPGETKIWQYVTLFKRISLIDCPGVVVDTAGDTEEDAVLKGVVRAERLAHPEDFGDAIVAQVQRAHINAHYKIDDNDWSTASELLEVVARRAGRLRKGGEPDTRSVAVTLINDFQRGRLPHYVAPPELKETVAGALPPPAAAMDDGISVEAQNLDEIAPQVADGEGSLDSDQPPRRKTTKQAATKSAAAFIGDGEWDIAVD